MRFVAIGAVFGFIGVAMGAFGAHALSASFSEKAASVYQTAAQYQMYHALALIGFGLWSAQNPSAGSFTGWAFSAGIVVFSGTLYALAITDIKILGAITPIGGLLFLSGWLMWAWGAFSAWPRNS